MKDGMNYTTTIQFLNNYDQFINHINLIYGSHNPIFNDATNETKPFQRLKTVWNQFIFLINRVQDDKSTPKKKVNT